jgi:hypothetical protein
MSIGSLAVVLDMVKHDGNMFDKLGVANRTQAVSRASHGLVRQKCSGLADQDIDVPSASERLHPEGPLSGEARHLDRP